MIGAESARLLGSLIVGLTWSLALSRASIPPEKRHMVSIYIDELQDYLSLPTSFGDALAQARGLGVAYTVAHQYRGQLPQQDHLRSEQRRRQRYGGGGPGAAPSRFHDASALSRLYDLPIRRQEHRLDQRTDLAALRADPHGCGVQGREHEALWRTRRGNRSGAHQHHVTRRAGA